MYKWAVRARGYLIQAVRADPLNILALMSMLVSFLGEDAYCKVVAIYRKVKYRRLSENS